ncbi:conserved hypothetical protein [Cupriavidus taiwanensis]|uniref:hypothetical protein n=1 Tax=Cupriavidus taiwanensis TaxID=164546 RepID=UPI000E14073F|nr:hypothetical protein [Cupriavidus taiwanensis]SOY79965.1 conserved hypothetical protein [Cupriavidus taiwanensis]SOY81934.1 conserved hypothetical protein [Cupriavidus taiwanensis]
MATIEVKGFVLGKKDSWQDQVSFTFHTAEMLEHGYITIAPYTLRVELPEGWDVRTAQIQMLERQKEKLRADLARRIQEINEEIQSLQAIEYTPEPEVISDVDGLPGHIPF